MNIALPDSPRGRILVVALTTTMVAALWFGIAAPLIGWYQARGEELAHRQALLQRMQILAESLPMLEHEQTSVQPAAADLLSGATDALAAATMQSAVQNMATASGIQLTSMETLPVEARGAYRRIALRVAFSAPWPVLIRLLQAARERQPHMLVGELQLRIGAYGRRGPDAPISASFTLLAFRASSTTRP